MTGHRQIVQARLAGFKPRTVFIEAGFPLPAVPTRFDDPEKALDFGIPPTVFVPPEDMGKPQDWRFLLGIACVIVRAPALTDAVVALAQTLVDRFGVGNVVATSATDGLQYREGAWHAWTF